MVRDENGKWLDTSKFRAAAIHFNEYGHYCEYNEGTPKWFDFWYEERRRCIDGYEVEGEKITGDHYFYLNYCPILKVEESSNGSKASSKIEGFPDFWDGDYNYFWSRYIARFGISNEEFKRLKLYVDIDDKFLNSGYNLIVGKSRRKGYSYKAAGIAAKNFFCIPNSLTIFGAYDTSYLYPKGLFNMAYSYINFVNKNTAWTMPSDVINTPAKGIIKASYIEYVNGVAVEAGFKSQIFSKSFKDNPDALRGKDAYDIFFEESGAFGQPGLLKDSYFASLDCVKAGSIQTGLITVFGTSGDMEAGTADYADMFERPEAFDFLPFKNIWDDNALDQNVGFFHPINWNYEGYYDNNGNSDYKKAKEVELETRRKLIDKGATSVEMQKRLQEKPLSPSEAFASASINNFPVLELKKRLSYIKGQNKLIKRGVPVNLVYDGNNVIAEPILDGKAMPITSYTNLPTDTRGCFMVYEQPVPNTPKGLYKIGYDPVRQDTGTSLAAIIVYKGVHSLSDTKNCIVAEYIGRLESSEDIDRLAEKIAIYYNTTIMFENEVSSVKNYFRRVKRLDLLAAQPDNVISKNIKNSRVARVYGCHMNDQLKDAGERYIKDWLLTTLDFNEHDERITTIDTLHSTRLIEELIGYNRKGNFDLVSALIMCLIQVQEEALGTEYGDKKEHKVVNQLINRLRNR